MTAPTLPLSRLINVAVNLTPAGAGSQNLSTLLILGSSDVVDMTERYRVYSSIAGVAADFGTALPEYLAALLWFEQQPQPANLIIGRWAQASTKGGLKGAPLSVSQQLLANWTAVVNGEFTYTKDGGAPTTTAAINFSGAANLSAVAALITAATPGVTFTWNSYYQRFEAQSATLGSTSAVSFASAPGGGTDISGMLAMRSTSSGAYLVQGTAPETAAACVATFDNSFGQAFYGVMVIGAVNSDHLAIAPLVEAANNKHVYFITTQEAGVIVAATTSDIAYQMKQLAYLRTFTQFSSSTPYAAASAAARLLTTDFNGNNTVITLMYKQEPGIVPESMNVDQITALEGKSCNVFVAYNNNTAIIEQGVAANGTFFDIVTGTDWLALTVQAALYNLLYTSRTKVPQTDAGSQLMVNTIEAVCAQAVVNGLLAPGVWNNVGFGKLVQGDRLDKGFYVYAPPVASQSVADRSARKAVSIQVAAKLAGAVHTIAMTINVNQ